MTLRTTLKLWVQEAAGQVADSAALGDSVVVRDSAFLADSTRRADSILAAAAADTSDAIETLGREVSDAGRRLADGDVDAFLDQLVGGVKGLASELAPQIVSAIFVGLVLYGVYRVVMGTIQRVLRRGGRVDSATTALVLRTIRFIGLTFVALTALSQLGVEVSALLAGLGIAGLAVGFAAKDSLENFISGLSILIDRPFRVGHWVQVGDHYGQVTEVTMRSTRLRTLNREEVVIPNLQMVTQPLVNQSAVGRLRIDIPFSVAYKEDIDETRAVVLAVVGDDKRLASEPEPAVVVTKMNESSVDMELHLHLKDASKAVATRFEYTEAIRKALGKAGIEIPFPHLQLFVDGADGLKEFGAVLGTRNRETDQRSDGGEAV